LDLSYAGARAIGMVGAGTDEIELRVVDFQGSSRQLGSLRIQVGSFSDPLLAQALLGRVRSLHYDDSRIMVANLPQGRRYRVQVGQYQSEQEAETEAIRVGVELQLDALVVRDENL
jgi:rare lipoprotein A